MGHICPTFAQRDAPGRGLGPPLVHKAESRRGSPPGQSKPAARAVVRRGAPAGGTRRDRTTGAGHRGCRFRRGCFRSIQLALIGVLTLVAIGYGAHGRAGWLQVASPDNAMCRRRTDNQFRSDLAHAPALGIELFCLRTIQNQTWPPQMLCPPLPSQPGDGHFGGFGVFRAGLGDRGADTLDHSLGSPYLVDEQAKVRVGDLYG